jgi:hypothetical protein
VEQGSGKGMPAQRHPPLRRSDSWTVDTEDAPHMAGYLRTGWKDGEKISAEGRCPGSSHWPGRLKALNPTREQGWTCVEYVRTGMSKGVRVMRVMFNTIHNDTIIIHAVAVRFGLWASGGPRWLTCRSEDPR